MNRLLTFTALIEAATGLALITAPSVVVRLLFGGEISGASIPLGRVAGLSLLSLGVAWWPDSSAAGSTASVLRAVLTYNSLATLYLLCLGVGSEWVGPLLWPAVVLHAVVTGWCIKIGRPKLNAAHEELFRERGKQNNRASDAAPAP